jgi:hypothetical protein
MSSALRNNSLFVLLYQRPIGIKGAVVANEVSDNVDVRDRDELMT